MHRNPHFHFSAEEITRAANLNRLLSLEIELSRACNYRCPYCYVGEPDTRDEMSLEVIFSTIKQAADLGAKKIVILGGEPLLYPHLKECVRRIEECSMRAEIFTNGALLTPELLAALSDCSCKFVVKLNSLNPEVQQRMTGATKDALPAALRAIECLANAGYGADGRLAIASVICSENLPGIVPLWKWARERGIEPYFEMMTPQGRLRDNPHLQIDLDTIKAIFYEICEYDKTLGFEWEPQPPLVGAKCMRHIYSALVKSNGEVNACVGIPSAIGNVKENTLADILNSSGMLRDFKMHRKMIKPPCRDCAKAASCYGCRGAAFQLTGDYLAADPMCWHNQGNAAIASLPCKVGSMLPHKPPMVMIEEIIATGHECMVGAKIHPEHPLTDCCGFLCSSAVPELAAQACAAIDAFRHDGIPAEGRLISATNVEIFSPVPVNKEILIKIIEESVFEEWHIVAFSIIGNEGKNYAKGKLKLCVYR